MVRLKSIASGLSRVHLTRKSVSFVACHWLVSRSISHTTVRHASKLWKDDENDFGNRNNRLRETGTVLHPLLLDVVPSDIQVMRIPQFIESYLSYESNKDDLREPKEILAEEIHDQKVSKVSSKFPDWSANKQVTLQGRISSIRASSKGLIFIDIVQDFEKVQIVLNRKRIGSQPQDFQSDTENLRKGDIISATGIPGRTRAGELSLFAEFPATLLAPCMHPLPVTLENAASRAENRVVDLMINKNSRNILLCRSTVLNSLRSYFLKRKFVEVQTPILSDHAGGASAKPFSTSSTYLEGDLRLRVAPELWLKRLVVGGFDKVFEIGPCFRNEGIDSTHNPEFTTCEFYQSYTTLEQLQSMTREILTQVCQDVQTLIPEYANNCKAIVQEDIGQGESAEIPMLDFVSGIGQATGFPLPDDLEDTSMLLEYFEITNTPIPERHKDNPVKLLDELASIYLESQFSKGAVYIVNHPKIMSPLAKSFKRGPHELSRRFELFVNGKELVNAYEEQNSPTLQSANFIKQLNLKDEEAILPDEGYVSTLQWGLPPTGGWGLGIDRLVMMLTNSDRIREVMSFGGLRNVNRQ